jgi:hypothetical protein
MGKEMPRNDAYNPEKNAFLIGFDRVLIGFKC